MISNIRLVFSIHGGWSNFFRSTYTISSVILTCLFWRKIDNYEWSGHVLSILPNIVGFSIAALAILTVIGDDTFRSDMRDVCTFNEEESDLVVSLASFIWFIFIQISAIVAALLFSARPLPSFCEMFCSSSLQCSADRIANIVFSAIGSFLFFYALLLALAAVFHVFHIFRLYIRNPGPPA